MTSKQKNASPTIAPILGFERSLEYSAYVILLTLAAASFTLSFEALTHLVTLGHYLGDPVASGGVYSPKTAWLFCIVLDGGIIGFTLMLLISALRGGKRRWQWTCGVAGFTILSIVLNIAHAHLLGANIWSLIAAGLPPLALFCMTECVVAILKDKAKAMWEATDFSKADATTINKMVGKTGKRSAPELDPGKLTKAQKKQIAKRMKQEGKSPVNIAETLGVSKSTIYNWTMNQSNESESMGPEVND